MEPAPLIDSALVVIFFNNDIESGPHPKLFKELLTSTDLDASLDRAMSSLARRSMSATYELVEVAQAVNRLRHSKGIEYLIPDKV
jgi:hypothetical protein